MANDIAQLLEDRIAILRPHIDCLSKGEDFCKFLREVFLPYLLELDILTKSLKLDNDGELITASSKKLENLVTGFLVKAEAFVNFLDDRFLTKEMHKMFRDFGECYYRSEILSHARNKPRGYPGDFEMMNHVYNNVPISKNTIGRYFDRYHLDMGYAQAVRGRKNKMVQILKKFIHDHKGRSLRILNLPCGTSRDIQELLATNGLRKDIFVDIHCVDHDKEALEYSKKVVINKTENIKIEFKEGNILNYIRDPEQYFVELGKFDLVYSIGIADYMPDKLLQRMLLFSWQLLNKDSLLIYAFKISDKDCFAPVAPRWGCEWEFVSRNTADVLRLISNSSLGVYSIDEPEWEESGRIAFFNIRKGLV